MPSTCGQINFVIEGTTEVSVVATMNIFVVLFQPISLSSAWNP